MESKWFSVINILPILLQPRKRAEGALISLLAQSLNKKR